MRCARRTQFLFLVGVLILFAPVHAQDFYQIKLNPDSAIFEINVDAKNKDLLVISTSIPMLNAKDIETKGGAFINLEAVDLVKMFGKGEPNLPVFSKLIEVPLEADVTYSVLDYDEEIVKLRDYGILKKIVPAQPSISKTEEMPFYYDSILYNKDEFADKKVVVFEELGIMRSVRIFRVQIHPIQYNPVQNELRIKNNLRIEIKFVGANRSKSEELRIRYSSDLFDRIISQIISNYVYEFKPMIEEVTYVIVADRMFETTLQPFILWKEALGYHVITGYTDEPNVGSTTASIKNFLQDLFNNPEEGINPPHYVLLVGDVDQIPSYTGTAAKPAWAENYHPTDLYYVEYTGDFLPDIFYGRFSANTVAELQPQIDKTLQYEQHSMPDPSYLRDAVLVAGADISHSTTYGNGQINYAADNYFTAANGFTAHEYLQPEPAGGNYSAKIRTDISNGAGFANYTAHCSSNGWSNPSFSIAHIAGLTNTNQYGLWIGNCCLSNRFSVSECFGEAALRAQNRGALGYIGASNSTAWDEDFWWAVGCKAVSANPVYDANHLGAYDRLFHTHGEAASDWYSTQGQLFVGGNLAVQESTSGIKGYYWEIYHLMGDPSVEIKTTEPAPMDVVHATTAPKVNNNFIVAVKKGGTSIMLPDATVTLVKNNAVVDSKKTAATYPDKGTAKFSYNLTAGPMTIYVSKPNYIPYVGTCQLQEWLFRTELWVSLHSGATLPYDDWYEETGCFNWVVNFEYHFSWRWALVFEVAYNDFMWREPSEHFPWWNISPTLRYYIPTERLRPYLSIGPGLYIPDEGSNRFGVKVGVGIDYLVNDRLGFEIGTDYHTIFPVDDETLYQDNRTSFQHFHGGLIYRVK